MFLCWVYVNKGGTNAGVMKHVGEAVKEQEITFGSEDKVNVIGVASWGIVDRKDSLIATKVKLSCTVMLLQLSVDCLDIVPSNSVSVENWDTSGVCVPLGYRWDHGWFFMLRSTWEPARRLFCAFSPAPRLKSPCSPPSLGKACGRSLAKVQSYTGSLQTQLLKRKK